MTPVATSTQPAVVAEAGGVAIESANPLVLWHLLSLDAPSVAMLWTWFIARANHVSLPPSAVVAMGFAVWLLYAADRLLDSRAASGQIAGLEARHFFHRRHQRSFRVGICLVSLALAVLLPSLAAQSLRLYLTLGAPLFAYFILIHAGPFLTQEGPRRLPKEIAVGVFFSAAVFIPTIAREPGLRLVLLPAAVLFAAACSFNCLFIYAWEHADFALNAHPLTRIALRQLPKLSVAAALGGLILGISSRRLPWAIPVACGLSSVLLLILNRDRHRVGAITLRAVADLCLLTPLLFLPLI